MQCCPTLNDGENYSSSVKPLLLETLDFHKLNCPAYCSHKWRKNNYTIQLFGMLTKKVIRFNSSGIFPWHKNRECLFQIFYFVAVWPLGSKQNFALLTRCWGCELEQSFNCCHSCGCCEVGQSLNCCHGCGWEVGQSFICGHMATK